MDSSIEVETREAALCLIQRGELFLVAEIRDPLTGTVLHRPPGGGVESGETPEHAVRREVREELNIDLGTIRALGAVDHVWFWKGREVRERAWLFLADQPVDPRLEQGQSPDLVEADGHRFKTLWRSMHDSRADLPNLCPLIPREVLELTGRW